MVFQIGCKRNGDWFCSISTLISEMQLIISRMNLPQIACLKLIYNWHQDLESRDNRIKMLENLS